MQDYKEVRFDEYCEKCKHKNTLEFKDPCNECLDHPVNVSSKPIKFEEKE